jgi:hypothetical protein
VTSPFRLGWDKGTLTLLISFCAAQRSRAQIARGYVVDPMLSDQRLNRLLALLPGYTRAGPGPVSGSLAVLTAVPRLNRDGAKDAACAHDSLLYPLLSRCALL